LLSLHSEENGAGWCRCVAWHVPTWKAFAAHSAEENLAWRRRLWERGEHDVWLAEVDGVPVASCQAGRRDRLPKLVEQYGLEPSPDTWAVTCFLVAPSHRRAGHARALLAAVVADAAAAGARRLEAFPRRGRDLEDGEAWTGPEALFSGAGFECVREHAERPVWARSL
jgi:GNAT superfamily N-acetyltransferase